PRGAPRPCATTCCEKSVTLSPDLPFGGIGGNNGGEGRGEGRFCLAASALSSHSASMTPYPPTAPLHPSPLPIPSGSAVTVAKAVRDASLAEVRKAVVGQDEALELMLCGLLAGGHILLEGVPGV